MKNQYSYPVYRYHVTSKYYILLLPRVNRAEVGIVENSSLVNDFMLWTGFKTLKVFTSTTPRKVLNKAKKWIRKREIK